MTHEELKILISAYIDAQVTPSEKNIVEEHLKFCKSCQKDYKMYKAISSSLSKWSNETLSPDEEIKVQKRFEQRRGPMFTKRTLMTVGTTLALAIMVGSVVQTLVKKGVQGGLVSNATDIGVQYSKGNNNTINNADGDQYEADRVREASKAITYEPYYTTSQYDQNANVKSAGRIAFMAKGALISSSATRFGFAQESLTPNTMATTMGSVFPAVSSKSEMISTQEAYSPQFYRRIDTNPPVNHKSKIRTTASMGLFVEDANKAQMALENIISTNNGIIINSQFNKSTEELTLPGTTNSWTYTSSGSTVFTVSPENLRKVLLELRKIGNVIWENQYGEDVTQQYLETQKRLESDQNIMDHFRRILERQIHNANAVDKIENAQELEKEVEAFQTAIEEDKLVLTQTDMATFTVNYYEKSNNPLQGIQNKWASVLKHSFEAFINTCSSIIVLFSSFLPTVVVLMLCLWGVYYLIKKCFKK